MRAVPALELERELLAKTRRAKARGARQSDKSDPPIAQALQRLLHPETAIRIALGEMDTD